MPNQLPDPTPHVLSRRGLLLGAGALAAAAGIAGAVDVGWPAITGAHRAAGLRAGKGTLVLITLYGGNDGINTVVPYLDPAYRAGRPTLGYPPDEVLVLSDGLALNPKLKGLKALWDAKRLAIVRGVGYPGPSLSHFQSMDIWQTASLEGNGSGWLGRWLDATGTDPLRAISLGSAVPTALRGNRSAATAITSSTITLPGRPAFRSAYGTLQRPGPDRTGLAAMVAGSGSDLLAVQADLAHLLQAKQPAAATPGTGTRATGLAEQLQLVASLIKAGAPTRVFQVSLSSFDTHAAEKANHERLLTELDQAVTGFFSALQGAPGAEDVVLMTYSEFGRRVAENASGGTDHGTAAPLFLAGAAVNGGRFYGDQPSLSKLDGGDLQHTTDFRSVYATVLERVIGVDPRSFLGSTFRTLPILA